MRVYTSGTWLIRLVNVTVLAAAYAFATTPGHAQSKVIANATPAAVIERLAAHLVPQGFILERQDETSALFTLDRGLVPQKYAGGSLPIVVELAVECKPVKKGLQVRLIEDVVAYRGQAKESRNRVRSDAELTTMERLLDHVQADLSAASSGKRDSL